MTREKKFCSITIYMPAHINIYIYIYIYILKRAQTVDFKKKPMK